MATSPSASSTLMTTSGSANTVLRPNGGGGAGGGASEDEEDEEDEDHGLKSSPMGGRRSNPVPSSEGKDPRDSTGQFDQDS